MTCGIYQILNTLNGKSYIGHSRNIHRRWRQHTRGLDKASALEKGSYPLRTAFLKDGLQTLISHPGRWGVFEFKIIEECTEDKLLERERFWIEKINPEYNCNLWTPARRILTDRELKFWVQYHNHDKLGYVPTPSLEYLNDKECECEEAVSCVSTHKSDLLNAQGDTVFVIVGIGENPKQYYLWSRLVIEEVDIIDEDGALSYHALCDGWLLKSPKILKSHLFYKFKDLCDNFGFGFISINNFRYLDELKHFSESQKLISKINFSHYVDKFYKRVIRVNPSEARRLVREAKS